MQERKSLKIDRKGFAHNLECRYRSAQHGRPATGPGLLGAGQQWRRPTAIEQAEGRSTVPRPVGEDARDAWGRVQLGSDPTPASSLSLTNAQGSNATLSPGRTRLTKQWPQWPKRQQIIPNRSFATRSLRPL